MTPTEDVGWYQVEDRSAPGQVRRAVVALAERLGFVEARRGEVAVAATELATNLHRHATAGTMAVRVRRTGTQAAVELVAVDSGPGIADVRAVMTDGHSTAGTLGVGLGAVDRLATRCDLHSVVGRGTVVVATFWPSTDPHDAAHEAGADTAPGEATYAVRWGGPRHLDGITRPINGESVCGDAWAWHVTSGITTVLLADGLGHGPLAATASQKAVAAFDGMADREPAAILTAVDRAISGTRGAAVSVAMVDPANGLVRFAGVGNVSGWVDDGTKRRQMVGFPGIIGQNRRKTIRQLDYEIATGGLVVLHSDGLSGKWALDDYPAIRRHQPLVVAASLLRDAGIRHDDASVVVVRAAAAA
jgi:anti-sigma regulatory factor (Ser/Thr protein kinase)